MMTHVSRRHVFGAMITLAAAAVSTVATIAAVPSPAAAAAGALAALVAAGSWGVPHAYRAVRGRRARQYARRAQPAAARAAGASDAPHPGNRLARLMVGLTTGAVATVAIVAVILNYAHGVDVARINAEPTWRALLYPLPADGLLMAASLALVWKLLATDDTTTWWPRVEFGVGIAASAGTNVLAACYSPNLHGAALVERAVWTTWPTVALLAAHEMLLMMLTHYATVAPKRPTQQAGEQRAAELETGRQDQAAALAELRTELNQARSALAELDAQDQEHDTADFKAIRAQVSRWISERLEDGHEVRTADVPRVFRVSLRWAQKHVPALVAEVRNDTFELAGN